MSDSFDLSGLVEEFRDEAERQLDGLDAALRRIGSGESLSDESRSDLLRDLHTLKGNAAMIGLGPVRDWVHGVETLFKDEPSRLPATALERLDDGLLYVLRAVRAAGTDEQESRLADVSGLPDPALLRGTNDRDAVGDPMPGHGGELERGGGASSGGGAPDGKGEPGSGQPADIAGSESVRVPSSRLDVLLDEVGRLIAAGGQLDALAARSRQALEDGGLADELDVVSDALSSSVAELRATVMELRLVPAARVLGRFPALARQIAREQGKEVRVELEGESTELDKSTVDSLAEPLLHLVRNAVDHGIERPEVREAAGKPAEGRLVLRAARMGERVRVDVEDDGAGLDRAGIARRASELGLGRVEEGDVASFVFRPGFSTRARADTVSGRGIGLDVVHRMVHRAQGNVEVADREGGGTRFSLYLPLRVAMVPAVFFDDGGPTLALPALDVLELLHRPRVERAGAAAVVEHRDELLPLVAATRALGLGRCEPADAPRFALVARAGTRTVAVAAQRVIDHREAIMKSLPPFLGHPTGVSGVAEAPDGELVLMLEPVGLAELNMDRNRMDENGG